MTQQLIAQKEQNITKKAGMDTEQTEKRTYKNETFLKRQKSDDAN